MKSLPKISNGMEGMMNLREKAKELMLRNHQVTGKKYICPSWPHYKSQWLWDSCFHAIICVELGLKDLAKNEIERLLKSQREDGWIPHMIYHRDRLPWFIQAERFLFGKKGRKLYSAHTQPPMIAQAVEAINDSEWTKKILPALVKFYNYFIEKQDPDKDGLISICHPHESGRDTSPELALFSLKKGRFKKFLFPICHSLSILKLEWEYRKLDWDIEKIWQKDLYNIEDLMFHCIWVDGLRSLARLWIICGNKEKAQNLEKLADQHEKPVYSLCYDEKDRFFYSLDSKNQKIKRKTISNLFPIILENIPTKMQQSIVEHLINPEEFWTPYPIPSIARNDPEFDLSAKFYSNWRGPVWINMNWFILRGLVKHGYRDSAEKIAQKTLEMIEREGFWEFYNPLTGKRLRKLTQNFGWSALFVTFPKILISETS